MLRLAVRKFSNSTNALNAHYRAYKSLLKGIRNNGRGYCNPRFASNKDSLQQQADTAVLAIFEKIARTDALINLLSGEISTELRKNIILNPDPKSKLRHIEITADKIRLEYSQVTTQFTVRHHT